jgi:hypothetical protein
VQKENAANAALDKKWNTSPQPPLKSYSGFLVDQQIRVKDLVKQMAIVEADYLKLARIIGPKINYRRKPESDFAHLFAQAIKAKP